MKMPLLLKQSSQNDVLNDDSDPDSDTITVTQIKPMGDLTLLFLQEALTIVVVLQLQALTVN